MAAGGHIEIWGCVLVSIIESNTIVWHMVSMCFSTNKLIYGIKFQLWVQIQDGRRTPYWILQKKVIQSYGAGIQKVDLQTTCFTSIWCELGKSKRCMVKQWFPCVLVPINSFMVSNFSYEFKFKMAAGRHIGFCKKRWFKATVLEFKRWIFKQLVLPVYDVN